MKNPLEMTVTERAQEVVDMGDAMALSSPEARKLISELLAALRSAQLEAAEWKARANPNNFVHY